MPRATSAEMDRFRQGGGGSPSRRLDEAIAAFARVQHTMVARRDLLAEGFGPDAIDFRLRRARLHRVFTAVYSVVPGRPAQEGWWMAAVLAAGPGAVLSHRAAAALYGMRPFGGCEVTVPGDRRPGGGIVVHRACLDRDEITTRDGIPVTGVSRTLLDLAAQVPYEHLRRAARRAEQQRLADAVSLAELSARHPRRRGSANVRRLLADQTLTADTRSHRLPPPETNVLVEGLTVDALWREAGLVVELDSLAFHGDRAAFDSDRLRDRLLQREGWRSVRLTKRHLTRESRRTAQDLLAVLGRPSSRSPGSAAAGR